MRDDASLRRLAEMGIDVYRPRDVADVSAAVPLQAASPLARDVAPELARIEVALVAEGASALVADVERALGFARIACTRTDAQAEAVLARAAAVVMFGESQARRAGALLPAQRQREIDWVVTGEPAALRGDPRARRALWSELKRIARGLARRSAPARR